MTTINPKNAQSALDSALTCFRKSSITFKRF